MVTKRGASSIILSEGRGAYGTVGHSFILPTIHKDIKWPLILFKYAQSNCTYALYGYPIPSYSIVSVMCVCVCVLNEHDYNSPTLLDVAATSSPIKRMRARSYNIANKTIVAIFCIYLPIQNILYKIKLLCFVSFLFLLYISLFCKIKLIYAQ